MRMSQGTTTVTYCCASMNTEWTCNKFREELNFLELQLKLNILFANRIGISKCNIEVE